MMFVGELPAAPLMKQSTHSTSPFPAEEGDTTVQSHPKGWLSRMSELRNDPRVWRPLVISLGAFPPLCFIWIFWGITFHRSVAIPDYLAIKVRDHPQSATMVAAVVATVTAGCVSFSFSLAVRYAIAMHLATRPTPLATLTSAARIAQKGLWSQNLSVKWACIVLLAYIGISIQTSALTSLLNVTEIQVSYDVGGRDLNFSSPEPLELASGDDLLAEYNFIAPAPLLSIMQQAMRIRENSFSTFIFNNDTYLTLTGGIQSATYVPVLNDEFRPILTNPDDLVPANLFNVSTRKHVALPFNKTMQLVQQGFTADVDCRTDDPRDNTTYRPTLISQPIGLLGNDSGFLQANLTVTCPLANLTTVTTTGPMIAFNSSHDSGALFAVACPIPNTKQYDFIIKAAGAYSLALDFVTCTIAPKSTVVEVTYLTSPANLVVPTTILVSEPVASAEDAGWGEMAMNMLLFNFEASQNVENNVLGLSWLLAVASYPNVTLSDVMNTYLQAGIEFSGTVFRQLSARPDGPISQNGTNNAYLPIQGTLAISTYGWEQDSTVSPLFVIPTTLMIIATYCLVIYGVKIAREHRHTLQKEDVDFDITDIVHLIAAYAPETGQDGPRNFSERSTYMRRISVRLGNRSGVRTFNVTASDDVEQGGIGRHGVTSSNQEEQDSGEEK